MFFTLAKVEFTPFSGLLEKLRSIDSLTLLVINLVLTGLLIFQAARKERAKWDTRKLVYGALCISLSFVLSYVQFAHMPQGGSVTPASMLPLMAFGYMFGPIYGLVAGLAYGLLQAIQDPYIVHYAQFFLDYPFAFAAVGFFPGLFTGKNKGFNFFAGLVLAVAVRFILHSLSGVIFFAEYAGGQNVWLYSLGYNSFVFIDGAICVVVALLPGLRRLFDSVRLTARVKRNAQ